MTRIYKTALVPYSATDMFTLVNDIREYPKFLPWCQSVEILSQKESEIVASITMGGVGLDKTFTTTNVLKLNESIEMRLLKGPFKHLYGCWLFQTLGENGCKISLTMEFEISNPLLRVSLGAIFTNITNSLIDAFVKRANELYGKSAFDP